MKRKMSAESLLKQEYNKELKRIKQIIRRAEQKGYIFIETTIPKTPKTITQKSIARLQKLTPQVLREKATIPTQHTTTYKQPKKSPKTKKSGSNISPSIDVQSIGRVAKQEKSKLLDKSQKTHKADQPTSKRTGSPYVQEFNRKINELYDKVLFWKPNENWDEKVLSNKQKYREQILEILSEIKNDPTEFYIVQQERSGYGTHIAEGYVKNFDTIERMVNDVLYSDNEVLDKAMLEALTNILHPQNQKLNKQPELENPMGTAETDADATTNVLERIEQMIDEWQPNSNWTEGLTGAKTKDKNTLKNMLNGAIESQGRETVARRCEEQAALVLDMARSVLYDSGSKEGNFRDGRTQVNENLSTLSEIIMGRKMTQEEALTLADLVETFEINN